MTAKQKLKVSFSGGETSALMAYRLKTECSHLFDLCFVFANTSQENEQVLICRSSLSHKSG